MYLSKNRADAVLAYLKDAQIDVNRIDVRLYGEQQARQVNHKINTDDLQPNRRVQVRAIVLN
jgi:outer membrane protein OmpA-like peptidoglycan-associated protein